MGFNDNGRSVILEAAGGGVPQFGSMMDIKRFLWTRVPVMVLVAVCVAIPAVTAAWFLVPVGYTASVELRFLATAPFVLSREDMQTPYDKFLSTQISLITGNAILSRVLDVPAIRELPDVANANDPLEYLKKRVAARVQRGSEIVAITCTMPDKDAAQRVLQEIVSAYMNYAMGEEAIVGSDRLATLIKERDARQIELDAQLKRIGDLQASLGVPIVGQTPLETGEGQLYNERLAKAEEDLAKAENQQREVQSQLIQIEGLIRSAAKDAPIYDFGVEDRVSSDGRVSTLRQEVVRAQANVALMIESQQENSPQIKVEQRRLNSLKDSVADLELLVRKEALESLRTQKMLQLAAIRKEVEEAQARATKFKELTEGYKERLKNTTDQFAQLEDLKSKAAETRRTLEAVRNSIATINVESNAPARIRLAAPVTVPGSGPNYLPRVMAIFLALAMSAGVGFGVGLLLELADQQVRSSRDLARLTKVPVIAAIPHASEDGLTEKAHTQLPMEKMPFSILADEYRRVLARLLYPGPEMGSAKSFVVVSPSRGDGKSTLTTNLGVALARAGRRVLIVDVSYRRPTLEKRLDMQEQPGLAEILNRTRGPEQVIRFARVPGLFVLGPGKDTGTLSGRLASRRMARFLNFAAERFDHVIIDTPPWLLMADAKLITPLVDGVFVVVGSGVSTVGMVKRCLQELQEIGANVMGIVLNGARCTPGGYMAKNRRLYYGYEHEDEHEKPLRPSEKSAQLVKQTLAEAATEISHTAPSYRPWT